MPSLLDASYGPACDNRVSKEVRQAGTHTHTDKHTYTHTHMHTHTHTHSHTQNDVIGGVNKSLH